MTTALAPHAASREPAPTAASSAVLYLAFAGTGVGLILPGAMLTLLLARWNLSDQRAGLLFFLFFLGSMSGAVLSRGRLHHSIARGSAAIVAGTLLVPIASPIFAFAAMALYGVGLGIVMTSISLLQSRLHPTTRTAEMARLNFIWAVGACASPFLGLRGSALFGMPAVFYAVALAFAVFGALSLAVVPDVSAAPAASSNWRTQLHHAPVALLLMAGLSTGMESSIGGWLSTLAHRSGQSLGNTISAVTWFWAGMLLSRLLQSHKPVAAASVAWLLRINPWIVALAVAVAVTYSTGPLLLVSAFVIGLAIGPLYPLALALTLEREHAGNLVFIAAGIGSSLLPFLTGIVSGQTNSLRAGLGIPLAAALFLGFLAYAVVRRSRQVDQPADNQGSFSRPERGKS